MDLVPSTAPFSWYKRVPASIWINGSTALLQARAGGLPAQGWAGRWSLAAPSPRPAKQCARLVARLWCRTGLSGASATSAGTTTHATPGWCPTPRQERRKSSSDVSGCLQAVTHAP